MLIRLHSEGRVPLKVAIPNEVRGLVMNQRATDPPEQVLKFAPKEKASNRVAQLDDAGQAIIAQIRTAADLAKEDCDRAMSLAHKLSMELRAAEDRTQQMAREVQHWRERAACAEQWLRTIQQEVEEKLLTRRPSSGREGVAVR
jgi:DNA repair exonuclease SbcCD ATPase subunit